ncbi:MAG TPA: ABC transporter ATP-binding protein [Thermodesulfobacteriota bacterium]|nr:ABC transporter ATP-binding protein [Thermodesulfobacteriota bacterium]
MGEKVLTIRNLMFSYGHIQALSGISFDVEEREIVTLIGNNGSGKSTTLNAICGVLPRISGEIVYRAERIDRCSSDQIVRMGICQVPEGRRVFPLLTVEENLLMGAFLRKDRNEVFNDLNLMYSLFPVLNERRRLPGGNLSGGEQQMLAIGRGLMAHPHLLLLDEPSLGLAPMIVKEIFNVIRRINTSGTTILLVEQNAKLALKTATKGYVMEKGKIVLQGLGEALLQDAGVRKIYFGET